MKKLYFVFDQLPNINDGGLIASYINLYNLLKDDYDINIISIFNYDKNTTPFKKIKVINNYQIDNRFYMLFSYLKKLEFKNFFKSIASAFLYFFSIGINRKKVKKTISNDDLIIVSCPSAGIFMPKELKFITEIHTSYNYFFGKNILGKLQGKLMTKPTLTLFRTKYDSEMAPKYLNPSYIYNFFDNENIKVKKKIVKNKLCYVGRIEDVKDPLRLINIVNELYKINNNITLDIYGTGSLFDECKKEIDKLELNNVIKLKGFTKDKNIYSNYSILLVTSKYEGLPMSIVEAKANGIPTISTLYGESVKEIINNDIDGYIVNNNEEYINKLNHFLTNDSVQNEVSKNALKSFEKFSKKEAYKNWKEILENYKK